MGWNRVSVKSYRFLMYSIGSFANEFMSFSVMNIIGIIVSYKIFSTNGFNLSMVFSYFVAADVNLIENERAFDPTNLSFFSNMS